MGIKQTSAPPGWPAVIPRLSVADLTASFLYVYVPDVDQAFRSALLSGAKELEAPQEMAYGDRRAMVEDPWGNRWQIATHQGLRE